MADPQPPKPAFRPFELYKISAGGIRADRIEAGTIQDSDGTLAAMTDQLIADLRAANKIAPRTVVPAEIQAGTIEAGQVMSFEPDALDPIGKAIWDQEGRRMALRKEFDARHPVLHGLRRWPVLGAVYGWAWRRYVLDREPQVGLGEPSK